MSGHSLPFTISKIDGASRQSRDDWVAVEEALEIRVGYETLDGRTESSVSITMRTPGDDAELTTGFLFTEAIIRDAADIASVKPGAVYTTFHNPETGANVLTTEYSDWATECPEHKVTAVQIAPASHRSGWQDEFAARAKQQGKIVETN